MQEQTTIENLHGKVSRILDMYQEEKNKNKLIKSEIETLQKTIEAKDIELAKLIEDEAMKDLELEDIISKIENIIK